MKVHQVIQGGTGRKKGLKVLFTSDKKNFGTGAQCSVDCIDPTPSPTSCQRSKSKLAITDPELEKCKWKAPVSKTPLLFQCYYLKVVKK